LIAISEIEAALRFTSTSTGASTCCTRDGSDPRWARIRTWVSRRTLITALQERVDFLVSHRIKGMRIDDPDPPLSGAKSSHRLLGFLFRRRGNQRDWPFVTVDYDAFALLNIVEKSAAKLLGPARR